MFDRHDESELLALIEDELDAGAAAAMRAKLARQPQAVAAIEQMRHQRQMLRSLDEPLVPADLMAPLEPLLARPMLIQTPGTDWRRRQRRMRQLRVAGAALAACLVLAGGFVAWQTIQSAMNSPDESRFVVAEDGAHGEVSGELNGKSVEELIASWPADAVIHHRFPDGDERVLAALGAGGEEFGTDGPAIAQTGGRPIAAEFAIVLTVDLETATTELRKLATEFNNRGALVRNISPDHYAAYEATLAADASHSGRRPELSPDVAAAINAPPLAGSRQPGTEPTLDQQARFAERGAAMTISIPIEELSATLQRLSGLNSRLTMLDSLPVHARPGRGISEPGPTVWLEQAGRIQKLIEQWRAESPGSVVMLPVVIEQPR